MEQISVSPVRDQLLDRRQRLEHEIGRVGEQSDLSQLLVRVNAGTFGLCETFHDAIEPERLLADPLARFCLDHLPPSEQRALERDLQLAAAIQRNLLPAANAQFDG